MHDPKSGNSLTARKRCILDNYNDLTNPPYALESLNHMAGSLPVGNPVIQSCMPVGIILPTEPDNFANPLPLCLLPSLKQFV